MGGGGGTGEGRTRREFLRAGGVAALGLLLGRGVANAAQAATRALPFYNIHTGEALSIEYFADGSYQSDGLRAANHVLRDHRTDTVHAIDPGLLDIAWALRRELGSREWIHVVSGYRSPETNEMLRRHRHGVAEASYHLSGRALDFFLPDREIRDLRLAALGLGAGGVGFYPRTGFVHVDTGPIRTW